MRRGFSIVLAMAMAVSTLAMAAEAPLDIDPAHPPDGYKAPGCGSLADPAGYPPISRRLGEQGEVRLRYVVDTQGHVGGVAVEKSSGYTRLDDTALAHVRQLQCTPATLNGHPVAVRLTLNETWKLTDEAPPAPASSSSGITPPVALSDHAMTEGDYPPLARARGEEGATIVYYVVNADGSVGDARVDSSSGYADLDAAAIDMVKSWRYKPATKDGKPLATSNRVTIAWRLLGPPPESSAYFTTVHMSAGDYPPEAKAKHEEGSALIIVYLDAQGHVLNTQFQHGTGYDDLDKATEGLVTTRWKFGTGTFMGKPASGAVALMVIWSLTPQDSGKAKDKN